MIKRTIAIVLFLLLANNTFADGFSPMELNKVLLETDVIILVEIIENKQTIKEKNKEEGDWKKSETYTNDIKSKVLSSPVGDFTEKAFNTKYSLVLVKGLWLSIPGSGLEENMKVGEKYVFLLNKRESKYSLQRAEKAKMLEKILQLKKEQVEEDRRVAKEQEKIPNGIYHYSEETDAQPIRLEDGRRIQLGDKYELDIVQKEMCLRYDIELCLTLASGKAKPCVLMVDGKAYWLYANTVTPGAKSPPSLHCSFNNKKDAEAIAKALKVSIVYPQSQNNETVKKKTPNKTDAPDKK